MEFSKRKIHQTEDDFNGLKSPARNAGLLQTSPLKMWERGYNVFTHRVWFNAIIQSDRFNEQVLCQNWQRRLGADTTPFIPIIDEDDVFNAVFNEQLGLNHRDTIAKCRDAWNVCDV
ncbi:hypothetical protein [Fretibacter rubidus]|uniref:hypothetical protein n=1 Tax=Fretibacter rubidus TaxID=570162 RepID=UPI00352B6963